MRTKIRTASLIAAALAWACPAAAQEPPGPKLPAMPSMDQKGSDDLTKPAGAEKKPAPAPPATPKPSKRDEPKAKSPPAAKHGLPPKQQVSKQQVSKQRVAKPVASKQRAAGSMHQARKPPPPKTRAPRKGR